MAKMIKQEGEGTKVAVRAVRKALMEQIKKLASKDEQRQQEKQVRRRLSAW
jgi:ribosome recycling factor